MNKKIPNVTLVAVDCTNRINATIQALVEGSEHLDFGAVKINNFDKYFIIIVF